MSSDPTFDPQSLEKEKKKLEELLEERRSNRPTDSQLQVKHDAINDIVEALINFISEYRTLNNQKHKENLELRIGSLRRIIDKEEAKRLANEKYEVEIADDFVDEPTSTAPDASQQERVDMRRARFLLASLRFYNSILDNNPFIYGAVLRDKVIQGYAASYIKDKSLKHNPEFINNVKARLETLQTTVSMDSQADRVRALVAALDEHEAEEGLVRKKKRPGQLIVPIEKVKRIIADQKALEAEKTARLRELRLKKEAADRAAAGAQDTQPVHLVETPVNEPVKDQAVDTPAKVEADVVRIASVPIPTPPDRAVPATPGADSHKPKPSTRESVAVALPPPAKPKPRPDTSNKPQRVSPIYVSDDERAQMKTEQLAKTAAAASAITDEETAKRRANIIRLRALREAHEKEKAARNAAAAPDAQPVTPVKTRGKKSMGQEGEAVATSAAAESITPDSRPVTLVEAPQRTSELLNTQALPIYAQADAPRITDGPPEAMQKEIPASALLNTLKAKASPEMRGITYKTMIKESKQKIGDLEKLLDGKGIHLKGTLSKNMENGTLTHEAASLLAPLLVPPQQVEKFIEVFTYHHETAQGQHAQRVSKGGSTINR